MSWLMLWTCTVVAGSGTLQVNNMGEMVASRGFPEHVAPACLALFSVSQATARVVTGALSEAALRWKAQYCPCFVEYGVPRPFFLVIASVLSCLAHFVLSFGNVLPVFVIGSVLSGIAFGMVWPLMVLIIGEVFGLDNHGANYMFYE
jgi:MFS family permease